MEVFYNGSNLRQCKIIGALNIHQKFIQYTEQNKPQKKQMGGINRTEVTKCST